MEINYDKVRKVINDYGSYIITSIKNQYYSSLSDEQRKMIDDLSKYSFIVLDEPSIKDTEFFSKQAGITDPSMYSEKYVPSAHGGRTKEDNKIHIYPYSKSFEKCNSDDEIIKSSIEDIVVHEIFHYFIRPNIKSTDIEKEEFGHFLTEGLVQHYAEEFAKNNRLGTPHSNYGKNVEFAKKLLSSYGSNDIDKIVFSGDDILSKSPIGEELFNEYKSDKTFRDNISSLVIDMCISMGMNPDDKNIKSYIKYYNDLDTKEDVVKDLKSKVDTFFNNNEELRNTFNNRLNDIYLGKTSDNSEILYNQTK